MENNAYLLNKDKLTIEQQKEMEKHFEKYYSVIYRFMSPEGKETCSHSTSKTQKQIGKDILNADFIARTVIEIGLPFEIGFNYDINGNPM